MGAYLVCDDADGCDLVLLKDRGGHQVSCSCHSPPYSLGARSLKEPGTGPAAGTPVILPPIPLAPEVTTCL